MRQTRKLISLVLSQKMCSIMGRVDRIRPRSVVASIERKLYMGWWSLQFTLTMSRMVPFPSIAMRYIGQQGGKPRGGIEPSRECPSAGKPGQGCCSLGTCLLHADGLSALKAPFSLAIQR